MICPSCRAENADAAEVCFECREVLGAITRGTVVASRYEIQGTLGRGGMGVVYAAHDRVLDEKVALKTLRTDFAGNEEIARRFRSEIKLARRVGHRNVCRIYEYGEDRGVHFIGMEYVEGIDLRQLIRERGPLTVREAFDLAIQALRGVEAVHEVGIVHRDLKTTNLMVDVRGVVRLMDFGIARHESDATRGGLTGTGQILGTPEYMSPEQARGEKVDLRCDVYALGVVIYEIFTGRVPFKGTTPMATLFMHLQEPPPLEGPMAAQIPAAVVPVLRRALAKDAGERYGSAQELLAALVAARATVLPEAPPIEPGDMTSPMGAPVRPPPRRQSRTRFVAVLLALLAVAVLIVRDDYAAALLSFIGATPAPQATLPPPAAALPTAPAPQPSAAMDPQASAGPRSSAWIEPLTLPGLSASPAPTTSPASPAVEPRGVLRLIVVPFADVTVDDMNMGSVVSNQLSLAAGSHVLVLVHPDFEALKRTVNVIAGETVDLRVDLPQEAVRKR